MNISKSKRNILIVVLTIGILMIISVPIMQQYKSKKVMNLYFSSERWNQLKQRHSDHPILPNCVLLFGDSMTENFEKYISNPQLLNFGISGDFSSGLITRVNSVVKQQPQQIFIMIGINDIIEKVIFLLKSILVKGDSCQSGADFTIRLRNKTTLSFP